MKGCGVGTIEQGNTRALGHSSLCRLIMLRILIVHGTVTKKVLSYQAAIDCVIQYIHDNPAVLFFSLITS
jgi:hypothetical protein